MTEDLGSKLKRAREASGVALRDIALTTKISVTALEALERNDFSRLPGGIFSRAFIRSYATAVGLDPEVTVQEYLEEVTRSESEAARVATEHPEVTPEDREFLDRQKRAIRLLQVAGVLLLIAIGTGAAFAWVRWTKAAAPASATNPQRSPQPPTAPPVQTAPQPSSPAATSGSTPPPSAGTQPPPATPPVTASPPPNASAAPPGTTGTAVVVPPEAPPPVPVPPVPVEPLTLEFEVTDTCFVEIAADGRVSFTKAMQPGERQRIQAQKELRLKVGDAGLFVWSLNGRTGRSLGAVGAARQVRITQANFKRYVR